MAELNIAAADVPGAKTRKPRQAIERRNQYSELVAHDRSIVFECTPDCVATQRLAR